MSQMVEAPAAPGAVLVLGGTSPIARAIAERFAAAGHEIVLAGRETDELDRTAADLRVRHGVAARSARFDAADFGSHGALLRDCIDSAAAVGLAGVVLCHGYMAEQADAQQDFELARRMIDVNYASAVSLLERVADHFETTPPRDGAGPRFVCGVSSVAGDRGRQSNYLYGSTKAALSAYLQGLRNRLSKSGVRVVTVKPGFVDTAMTFGRKGVFLVAKPQAVGADVQRAVAKGRDVVYTPWFWRWIMLIIKSVPERVFKRMKM